MVMLKIDNLSFRYEQTRPLALDKIDLDIQGGDFVLLAGPSGSGKSTLLKAMAGVIPQYQSGIMQGNLQNNGLDTRDTKLHNLSLKTGILFQNPDSQFFNLSVEDEICFGMLNRGWENKKIAVRLEEIIDIFDLALVRKLPPQALSEGQKQRTVLASILATYPEVLLLDEPFAHLDETQSERLIELLQKLNEMGTTIVVAEHRLNKVIHIVSRAILMKDGRIVYDIEPAKLLDSDITQKLGLRDFTESTFEFNPIIPDVEDCLLGIEKGSIEYRSGFQIYIDYLYANRGKNLGLMGPNGCGKTTLLKVLSGLKKVKKGKTIPHKIKPGKLSTLVYQQTDNQLFMDTVEKEVFNFSKNQELAQELMKHFRLEHLRKYNPFSLSEGEKQRVVLAASIGRNVPVLLLDEPTTGMDGFQLNNFMKLLDSDYLNDTACIIASHDKQLLKTATHEQYIINAKN